MRTAQGVAANGDPGIPHDDVMAAMDALDVAHHTTSPEEARRVLAPHAALLFRAQEAGDPLTNLP